MDRATGKRKPSRVTLAQVADQADVSVTTASLILSGKPHWLEQFNPDTITRVRDCARKLGYRANLFASGLSTHSTPFFALVVQDIEQERTAAWHHWAFEGAMLAGAIAAGTSSEKYPVVTAVPREANEEATRPVRNIIDGGVFGTIVRTPSKTLEKYLKKRLKSEHPLVVVFPRKISDWPTNALDIDNVALGESVGTILNHRKRRCWAVVRYTQYRPLHRIRIEGLEKVARKANAEIKTLRLPIGVDEEQAGDIVARRFKKIKPDGVFAVDSISSVGSLLGLAKMGVTPGEDLDLVGCDVSSWQGSGLPRITSIDISWKAIGKRALQALVAAADSGNPKFKTILIKPSVAQADTCPVPADMRSNVDDTDL
jgi:LacI family transcriptional regulator